ncbi:Phthiocerol/phenolphthiocerol synthesis polyketide synthase type I PpsA [Enhygromyxa salina]|uniref:Phthiocerol/phenolphthiocerol synthesis polyketide synthase type I PpsA n=1 Tax=Enhygromyxa salina TaxID=215803 RepID=A0A2S9XK51_9BACT|nr:type I polyketide synthase [Enhygromyxa salina]PRP93233.1 Phthiocerol/phenolphthiocerol synthesis polyketide synthase type I PpsA [Enhygromyxa salina]
MDMPTMGAKDLGAGASSTLVEVARRRGLEQPELGVYTFLNDGERDEARLDAGGLDRRARAVAAALQQRVEPGARALLLYPPGLDYIVAFFGCLYAGVIAVPAYPPDPRALARTLPRLQAILADCEAELVLTNAELIAMGKALLDEAGALAWLASDGVDEAEAASWRALAPTPDDLAFLQYTSGSTDTPKGVMLTHANLVHNSAHIRDCFGHTRDSQGVIWLPPYHDMGLIGGIIQPLYVGFPVTLMSPLHFLQRPMRWLEAISRYGATTSGGPNFAYDLCVRRSSAAERDALELSSWDLAFNGAEPIRPETLARFAEHFAGAGFQPAAFYPCYGLAEATLIASGGDKRDAAVHGEIEGASLVSCGRALDELAVVHAHDDGGGRRCAPAEVGEIWVAGPSVARGYWGRETDSAAVFDARLDGEPGAWLRTGDLGALDERGELFVTGRCKDLIIIRGRNLYPHDLERTVEACDPGLRPGCGAVFGVEGEGQGESLAVVQEFDPRRSADTPAQVIDTIRAAILAAHAVAPAVVVLVEARTIPKTSSGKIQRFACREGLARRELKELQRWTRGRRAGGAGEARARAQGHELRAWMVARVAARLGVEPGRVDTARPLAELGLDSAEAVGLSGELEARVGRRLPPTLVYEHPSIDALVAKLDGEASGHSPATREARRGGHEPLAIVGIGCRFPGADGPAAFWQLLREGVDAVGEVSSAREQLCGRFEGAARHGAFLPEDQVVGFDAEFFGITPREAAAMDPQQRLLLELAWETIEDAGLRAEELRGTDMGVFVGVSTGDYARLGAGREGVDEPHAAAGNASSVVANRLSYALDLRGPSLAVDSACSSSLVAVHLACRSLWSGESRRAIAAGVNLVLAPALSHTLARAGFLAPGGRCRTFAADAEGYVRGEGAGVVVLEPLAQALAGGRRIYATIRGTAVNSDGRSNGLTAPNLAAQVEVIRAAHRDAGVRGRELGYVEAHGTGTVLGDPIEIAALARALGPRDASTRACALGSVKTNIGHLEAAAGVAGLIKTALALHHGELPPSLHASPHNPHIEFEAAGLRVVEDREAWPVELRRAGVSSFGFGGTNAHVVLERAPSRAEVASVDEAPAVVLPISARSEAALRELAGRHAGLLDESPSISAAALARAAATTRSALDLRAAVLASSRVELRDSLRALAEGRGDAALRGQRPTEGLPRVAFVFGGQGNQWHGMGRALLESSPAFRGDLEACDDALRPLLGWSVLDLLGRPEDDEARWLDDSSVAQPVLFALQVALARCWQRLGVAPDFVVGHSLGELAAAHVAGALSLADAARLVAERARATAGVAGLAKLAVLSLGPDRVAPLLGDDLEIVAHNGPAQTVVCGPAARLEQLEGARLLAHEYPFHSRHMAATADLLAQALAREPLSPRSAAIPFVSTLTGAELDGTRLDAGYWVAQVREPVRFAAAISTALAGGCRHFVEIGAHPALAGAMLSALDDHDGGSAGVVVHSLRRKLDARRSMLEALAELFVAGHAPRWSELMPEVPGAGELRLPRMAWQRVRAWQRRSVAGTEGPGAHPLLGRRVELGHRRGELVWASELSLEGAPYLGDHRFEGAAIVPAAVFLELALAAALTRRGASLATPDEAAGEAVVLREVEILAPLRVPDRGEPARALQLALVGERFEIRSKAAESSAWILHARGAIASTTVEREPGPCAREPDEGSRSAADHYADLRARGLDYGPAFRGVERVGLAGDDALAELRATAAVRAETGYHVHPALLDAAAQIVAALPGDERRPFLPAAMGEVRFLARPQARAWSRARVTSQREGSRTAEVELRDEHGRLLMDVCGLELRYLDAELARDHGRERGVLYELGWAAKPLRTLPHAQPPGTWLILAHEADEADDDTTLAAAREGLAAIGERCVWVRPGSGYACEGEDRYRVDPTSEVDIRELFELLRAPGRPPLRGVVFGWGLAREPDGPLAQELEQLERARDLEVGAVVLLLRELVGARWPSPPQLWLLSRGAVATATPDQPSASVPGTIGAALWGLGRTIAQEHPDVFGGLVDLDPAAAPDASARALLRELRAPDGEPQIAYRGGRRHAARVTRSGLRESGVGELRCRVDASYLITGGLGGLGLEVARALVDRGARRLVLMGRSRLPARAQWASLDPSTRVGAQVAAIRALEREGVSVHVAAVDVGDAEQVRAFVERYRGEGWPEIRGVVHLAGVLQDQILVRLDPQMLAAVFRAKVMGAWVLHRVFEDAELFVLFSSVAAVLGSAGQGNYAAANSFLDALAQHRRARGLAAHAIDWGPWAEVGLARADRQLARRGIHGLAPERALGLLGALLGPAQAPGWAQVTVMDVDWVRFARAHPTLSASAPIAELVASAQPDPSTEGGQTDASSLRAELLAVPASERPARIEGVLASHVARAVGRGEAEVEPERPLAELGLDSLMGVELRSRIEVELGVTLPMTALLDGASIRTLAAELNRGLGSAASAASARLTPTPALRRTQLRAGSGSGVSLIHPGALDVEVYAPLAAALDGHRVEVLELPELDAGVEDGARELATIEQLATRCAEHLAAHGPLPSVLGGWSLGGVLAYEVAVQLRARGQEIERVVLLDSPTPRVDRAAEGYDEPALVAAFCSYLRARARRRGSIAPPSPAADSLDAQTQAELLARARAWALDVELLPPTTDEAGVRTLFEIFVDGLRRSVRRLAAYRPRAYVGPVTYLRAADTLTAFAEVFPASVDAWTELCEVLVSRDVPGDHYGMFEARHAARLAAALVTR